MNAEMSGKYVTSGPKEGAGGRAMHTPLTNSSWPLNYFSLYPHQISFVWPESTWKYV